jgi:hypothetical protein
VLIDGDGVIFKPELITRGRAGGQEAALMLSNHVKDHINCLGEIQQPKIFVNIFFNKYGLSSTLQREFPASNAARELVNFMHGFSQASERFLMADVGSGKEAADAKMRGKALGKPSIVQLFISIVAILEDEIALPQTYKIIFGGKSPVRIRIRYSLY